MTVSDAGLRISLADATRAGNHLWLTFRIESADMAQPNLLVLGGGMIGGFFPEFGDFQLIGLKWDQQDQSGTMITPFGPHPGTRPPPPPPSPTPYPTPEIVRYLYTMPFLLTGSPDQPATVTIHRVRFQNTPPTPPPGKIINGSWSFTFVPATLPEPTPTPTFPPKP